MHVTNVKSSTDVSVEVRHCLEEAGARAFYTAPKTKRDGGRGWSNKRFDQVEWGKLAATLDQKPDMYGILLSRQTSGMYAARHYLVRQAKTLADQLDKKCSNCGQVKTPKHPNQCPSEYRAKLLDDGMEGLEWWIHQDGHIDPEITYWVPKYSLL